MPLPRLPEGFSLRKPAVLALVVVLLGGSAIFGLTADNMRSAPTGTTNAPDIAQFDPVLASFNFRKTAQSSLAMAVSFLRQAQSGAYDIAAVAPRIEQQANAAGEAADGANRAVDTANDALAAAKRDAESSDSPGGQTQTTEESEAIRSLEAGVQAAKKYADDANKFRDGTDKLLAAVKQAQKVEDRQRDQQGQQPGGPALAAQRPGTGPAVQPPSWLQPNGGGSGSGNGGGNTAPPPPPPTLPPTTTTKPKPLSPCESLSDLEKIAKKVPEDPTATDEATPAAEADGGLSPVEAKALVKVCKALKAHKALARDPKATPTPEIQAILTAQTQAANDLAAFANELNAELQSDPAKPATGFFITEQFVQPAADAQADYELKAGAATQAATVATQAATAATQAATAATQATAAAQAAAAASAANPADKKLAADAAAKQAAATAATQAAAVAKAAADKAMKTADDAKKAADEAKKLTDDVKKIADEVQSFPGHVTSVQTRTPPTLPADTKLSDLDKTEAAWVVLMADLEVKRDAATQARADARVALAAAEKSTADLAALPPDTAPAARDALIQQTGQAVVDTLVAWRSAVAAIDAEADAADMASMAQQLWARADAKARGVEPPDAPAPAPTPSTPASTTTTTTTINPGGSDPVDPPRTTSPAPGTPG